jgi:N-methylhydantoinase A
MRIGVDTGGTFTDVVVADGARLRSFKVPSTPRDPSAAILGALGRIGLPLAAAPGAVPPFEVVHGSTVATNALLEGKTARAALLVTEGFEDILEIGRQTRPALYDIEVQRSRALVPRALRFGIPERVLATGTVHRPLDGGAVRDAAEKASHAGAESIAVCFLHSYAEPRHEEEAGRLLGEFFPGFVTLSSALVREFREYERCSTAAVNAAVAPVVGAYLARLAEALPPGSLRIMGSNGGAVSPARAAAEAVATVLSGPAAGVVAAQRVCDSGGLPRVISFDMGGTSTDVSLVPGEIVLTGETLLAGHPIQTPVIDIHTVGAGGGSVAWIDAGGALKVGPQSAGADPGPACYGRGGPATVTDAHVILGRIVPDRFLDGEMPLETDASARGVGALASTLGMTLEETAAGILEVANVTMARAIRQVSLFKGHDPAGFALCAFGGAGGLHAADLARAVGTPEAVIPASPGVFSAWGLLAGDLVVGRSATVLRSSSEVSGAGLSEAFAPLEGAVLEALEAERRSGFAGSGPRLERFVDGRYRGQSHELRVSASGDWVESFHAAHEGRYGFCRREEEVVAVTLRVVGRALVAQPPSPSPWTGEPGAGTRSARRLWERGAWRDGFAVERSGLRTGEVVEGPAVITEAGSTTFVPSGAAARVAPDGSLRLTRGA